jgi:ankyrin repeat protein
VRALIAEDPSLARSHYDYRKPLYFAVRENRIDIVQFLLEHDRNPIDLWVDDDPIEIARDRGYTEMEQLLAHTLETTFNASAKGEPVALSLRNHDLQQMNELLDAQPELVGKGDRRSNQPIHWATMTRQLDAIDELLRRGADINARRMDGGRPIHLTNGDYFYRGWRDVPRHWPVTAAQVMAYLKARGAFIDQLLLERGAFPNPPVESSGDALWWSRERRPDKRMEQLLLSYGAKPTKGHTGEDWPQEAYNWLRISPPHQAARKGDVPEAKKLLEAGADLTARDEHLRSTPLAWAAKFGQLEMVKFLLGRGTPKSLPDDADWATPRAWAIRRGHEEVARLLS